MRLRFRIAGFFSLLFSFLIVCSAFVIYFLFEKTREKDFSRRLWAQAYYSYGQYFHHKLDNRIQAVVSEYHPGSVTSLEELIADSTGKPLYTSGKTIGQIMSPARLAEAKQKKYLYFTEHGIQYAVLYIPSPTPSYVVTSGYDKFGIKKVNSLETILMVVAVVGICFIVLSAIFIIAQITKPLIRLGLQMQRISESNLVERIEVKSGRLNYEEKQIATHFNAMLDRLERAFELQRSFVHHASHELRTPLATMLAQTELALRKDLTIEEARRVLESLKEDQQEMVELTNSLLLLSQYERTSTSTEWPVVRLDELLYDTMAMVKRMLPNVNVSLEFAQVPDNELFLSIQGNDSLIRSAFRNLIKNAWLYSDNKSVAITIDATSTDIYLHFDNNGKLLSLEEQERLFIPFFRASNSTQKKGFGLGLNIIQRIVSLHKGSIGYIIYNNMNRFTLQFPKLSNQSAAANGL